MNACVVKFTGFSVFHSHFVTLNLDFFFQLKIKIYEDKKREVRVEKRQAQNK